MIIRMRITLSLPEITGTNSTSCIIPYALMEAAICVLHNYKDFSKRVIKQHIRIKNGRRRTR